MPEGYGATFGVVQPRFPDFPARSPQAAQDNPSASGCPSFAALRQPQAAPHRQATVHVPHTTCAWGDFLKTCDSVKWRRSLFRGDQATRPGSGRCGARLSVALGEEDRMTIREMAQGMDISAAWAVRRAAPEFMARRGNEQGSPSPDPDGRAVREERKTMTAMSSAIEQAAFPTAGDEAGGDLGPRPCAGAAMSAMENASRANAKGAD